MTERAADGPPEEVRKEFDEALTAEGEQYKRELIGAFRAHGARDWKQSIRHLHDQAFLYEWQTHLNRLNTALGFMGNDKLCTPRDDLPPALFNGNVDGLEPGLWVLFMSLNPQLPGDSVKAIPATPAAWWKYWLTHNEEHWWGTFFWRPTLVASLALGEQVADADLPKFASKRMVYVEACPYASANFSLSHEQMTLLARQDIGFLIAQQTMELLLEGAPAAVFVNGNPAIEYFDDSWHGSLQWKDWSRYASCDNASRFVRHREGCLITNGKPTPVFAFPFLGKQRTHNSTTEITQLGELIRTSLVEERWRP